MKTTPWFTIALLLTGAGSIAQTAPDSRPQSDSKPTISQKIQWPADRDRVVCQVAGRDYTIGEVVAHIEQQHWPGLTKFLALKAGRLYFSDSALPARWVRQFADIKALELEARERELGDDTIAPELSAALKDGFQNWFDAYWEARRKRGQTQEPTQTTVNTLLTRYQNEFGLETELRGWLNALVPALETEHERALRQFYTDYANFFGGRVTASQIVIRHREPTTGELLTGDAGRAARRKLRDVESRLAKDGSNFEELARLYSDDPITASKGGVLPNIQRFDPLLPAAVCRTAWSLADGQFAGPFETPYGYHFIKRLSYSHTQYVIYTEALKPRIIDAARKLGQENTLFGARKKFDVKLLF